MKKSNLYTLLLFVGCGLLGGLVLIPPSKKITESSSSSFLNKNSDDKWKFIFIEKEKILSYKGTDKIIKSFDYYNDTKEKQNIDTIKTSCGCTHLIYSHTPIMPGDKGKIEVTIDVGENLDFLSKSIVVYFHNQKPVVLRVSAKRHLTMSKTVYKI